MADRQPPQPTHLGDGVYASFDGYQIWLAVGDHRNNVVALEPGVLERLIGYAGEVNTFAGSAHYSAPVPPPRGQDCPLSPDGRHQIDTTMESGPSHCFHCGEKMP
jgi:hypothetical protein